MRTIKGSAWHGINNTIELRRVISMRSRLAERDPSDRSSSTYGDITSN
ncbi:MAG TPA: hypothetical protein V6C85_04235 [Allocoleopsis sp.]